MGNILSCTGAPDSTNEILSPLILDDYDKNKLIDYIKRINPKKINLDDIDQMKSIELENKTLIPMTIELYYKLFDLYGEYLPMDTKKSMNKLTKRVFFIKPKFGLDDIINHNTISVKEHVLLANNLVKINDPSVSMLNVPITLDEYTKSFNDTPIKKDMLGISKKILKLMPVYLKMRFINCYNEILLNPTASVCFAKGFYMYKLAKHGPTSDINSFRQIMALPNIINQMHRILNIRLCNYMMHNKYIDTNIQKGCIPGQKYSIFEQFFKIKNVIADANKRSKPCVVLFLDITNAFGEINLYNLYQILELYHVDAGFINYLKTFYDNLEYYVDTGNVTSNNFKWQNGLIQGCSLSPLLFIIAMNYILVHLDENFKEEHGYEINNAKMLLTAYVDDICIVCSSLKSAKLVYNKFKSLCAMLGLSVSKTKSAAMIINEKVFPDDTEFPQSVTVYKYLGEHLTSNAESVMFVNQFISQLMAKMKRLNKSNYNNSEKISQYEKFILPWIQKKTLLMYDMGMQSRLKIISIIKDYSKKWNCAESNDLFCDINLIIKSSEDDIIKKIISGNIDFDYNLKSQIDISNYVCTNERVAFKYEDVDNDLEIELQNLYKLTN